MSTKRINVTTILPPSALFIGYVAENGVTNVEFDVSAWVTMYGSGTATLIMKRWGDANPYPIALEVDNEGLATWTISATDTAKKGFAYAQLRYEAGTKVKKSPIYTLKIGESLGSPAEAPDQYEDWIDALTHLAAEAMAEVLDIEGIVTDKTLTVDGGIADAKATGDALSALEDQFTEETDQLKADLEDNVNNLKGAIRNDGISIESSSNMIDPSVFVNASGIHVDSAGYYIGTAGDYNTNFGAKTGVPGLSFETEKQYSFKVTVFSDDSESTSNGIRFRFYYTDNTNSNVSVPINTNTPTQITGTSTSGKTVSKFCILYANGPSVVWHIKDFMLSQSASPENFVPHLVPVDSVARGIASENTQEIGVLSSEQSEILEKMPTNVVNIPATWSRGYWDVQTDVASFASYSGSYYASNAISVTPGKTYSVYVKGGTSTKQRPVVIVDVNYNVLYKCDAFSTVQTVTVTIPANGAYLLVTNYKSSFDDAIISTTELDDIPGCNAVRLDTLKGKKVAIIGDSISTNGNPGSGDYPNAVEITITNDDVGIELSAYLTKFDVDAGLSLGGHTFTADEIGTEVTFVPVAEDVGKVIGLPNNYNTNVTKTWWEVAMERLGFEPIPVCWSGASITSHEADSNIYKTSYAWHDAQIRKCGIRTPGTMYRTAPDMIIVYRGTNDFSHSPVTMVTENYPGGVSWVYPETDVVQTDKFGLKEGLCLLVKKLRQAYPNATIYFCTLNVFKRMNYANFPTRNSYNTLPEYNDAIRETARFLGIDVIDFANDGITFENCYIGGYITDSAETPTHPSDKGHKVMGEKAIADLLTSYSPLT